MCPGEMCWMSQWIKRGAGRWVWGSFSERERKVPEGPEGQYCVVKSPCFGWNKLCNRPGDGVDESWRSQGMRGEQKADCDYLVWFWQEPHRDRMSVNMFTATFAFVVGSFFYQVKTVKYASGVNIFITDIPWFTGNERRVEEVTDFKTNVGGIWGGAHCILSDSFKHSDPEAVHKYLLADSP